MPRRVRVRVRADVRDIDRVDDIDGVDDVVGIDDDDDDDVRVDRDRVVADVTRGEIDVDVEDNRTNAVRRA